MADLTPQARQLALIAAHARGRVIGKDNDIPWDFPQDRRFFRRHTSGHAIIMGHRTYRSIGRPLPKRRNLVLSRQQGLTIPGCEVFSSLDEALQAAWTQDEFPFVIGGEGVYREALPLATHLYLTEIDIEVEGDTFFPAYDTAAWEATDVQEEAPLRFVIYQRRQA